MRAMRHKRSQAGLCGFFIASVLFGSSVAFAQEEATSSVVWDVTKAVVFDPTTYVPATVSYAALRMDWKSSQPLFHHGWLEQNRMFTVSGRPNDTPISFQAGNQQIRRMALAHLQESLVNNLSVVIFERVLTQKYPQHRKLFKVLSWAERIGFASFVSYKASVNHFRQTQRNHELARQHGYR
jgi:hypothetical protein